MASSNNPDALSQDGELPFGHQGRRFDDTPEGFSQSPPVDQGPELDYTPDEGGRMVHYGPVDRPLCGNGRRDRGLHRRPGPGVRLMPAGTMMQSPVASKSTWDPGWLTLRRSGSWTAAIFPKQGRKSAGVARQYCGRLGKVANCLAGMFLAYVSPLGRALVDKRLYLPESWTSDSGRGESAGVPVERRQYRSKTELALEMLARALERGHLEAAFVAGDDAFGMSPSFRDGLAAQGMGNRTMTKAIGLGTLFAETELPFSHPGRNFDDRYEPRPVDPPEENTVHYGPGNRPRCGNESVTAVYTDDPNQVQGCEDCLELVAEDMQDHNAYLGRSLHCRREITAQGGVE